MYKLLIRGEAYLINTKGEITSQRTKTPSGEWLVYGVAKRWNSHPIKWTIIKKQLDEGKTVEGYFYDVDHGTVRMWSGSYQGKIPKAKIYKIK